MNSQWMKPIGATVLAAGLTFAYAQTSPAPNRQAWMQKRFDRMSTYLNLTDAQKTQAQAIFKESHEAAQQYRAQLKQNREALAQAVKANNPADIERLSAVQGQLMGKMVAIHSEAFAKLYQTLTPEQRAKADTMKEHFRGMQRPHNRPQS